MSKPPQDASVQDTTAETARPEYLATISGAGEVLLLKGDIDEAEHQARALNEKITHSLVDLGLPLPDPSSK